MITRAVLIQFNEDAPEEAIQAYEQSKIQLQKLPIVKNMISGQNFVSPHEQEVKKYMNRVTYPQSASIWQFASEADFNEFLTAPEHKKLATSDFVQHMKWRYVANLKS